MFSKMMKSRCLFGILAITIMLHGIIKAIDIRLDYDMEKEIFFPMDYETHPEDVHEINVLTDATESSTDRC